MSKPAAAPQCAIPGCSEPSGRRLGHPVISDHCRKHGGDIYCFGLWLGMSGPGRIGGPDESFDSARGWWEREAQR